MNTTSSLATEFEDKAYRDSFVASQLRIGLPMQCRALRESRGWTQPQLAEAAGMSQPRISEIERAGERKLNLETLLRLASAFDVALQVQFVPFSELVDHADAFDYDAFYVRPFTEDMAHLIEIEARMKSVLFLRPNSSISRSLEGIGQEVKGKASLAAAEFKSQPEGLGSSAQIERKYSESLSDLAS